MNKMTRYLITFFVTGVIVTGITVAFSFIPWYVGLAAFLLIFTLSVVYWEKGVDTFKKWIYKPSKKKEAVVEVIQEDDETFEAEYNPFDFKTTPETDGNAALPVPVEDEEEYMVEYDKAVPVEAEGIIQKFILFFDIDIEIAQALVEAGYTSLTDFEDVQAMDLLDIEGVDSDLANRLVDKSADI